ncbi:hypothetical protein VNO77_24333 [Canavalia gladiata]|uniref:Uncharacterized protein n=1 Tax=Canavalia gladiata TaxID=3824 RepID=A0AAN9L629_CANGL
MKPSLFTGLHPNILLIPKSCQYNYCDFSLLGIENNFNYAQLWTHMIAFTSAYLKLEVEQQPACPTVDALVTFLLLRNHVFHHNLARPKEHSLFKTIGRRRKKENEEEEKVRIVTSVALAVVKEIEEDNKSNTTPTLKDHLLDKGTFDYVFFGLLECIESLDLVVKSLTLFHLFDGFYVGTSAFSEGKRINNLYADNIFIHSIGWIYPLATIG